MITTNARPKTDPKTTYIFVIVGTNIKLTFTGNSFTRHGSETENTTNMQILRDDTIQTVKKKLLMQLNRVYPTDVAYEELFLTAYAVSMPDPAQIFREALVALKTDQRVYLTQTEVAILCKKYGCNNPALNKTDKYYLSDFINVFHEPTRKLVAIGAKFAEHKYPFFIPDPSIPVTSDIELDFSETQLLFQYGELADNVIYVNIAQHSLSDSEPGQHESILRTFYRSLQYTHGIVNFAQLNEKHAELVEHTNAAITEKTERAFKSVQVFHDIYATRTEEMPWISRGIASIHFALNTNSTQGFPLESIFKSVHSSRQTPLIKYTPGNRREPIYRIYSERVSPNGQKIAYLPEKKITKLARELGKAGQVSVYVQCKRNDISLNMHFDRTGLLIIECEFNQSFSETDATEVISSELNPILKLVGKYTPGLNIPDFVSLREVDILQMKYVMKCEITKNIVFKNMPCLNSILLVESSDLVAGASLRYVRVDNYREMNAQTMFINDNRDDVPTMMTGLMRNFGMSEEEAKMRIVSFFNEHADIRGKVLDNPGFLVDMRIPRMESAVVITVERVTSLKYVDLLHLYFDSILRLSQKPKSTAVTNEHMIEICKGRAAKSLIDTDAVVQNLPAKPIAVRNETFNLMEALGLKEPETFQEFAEDDDDTGVFFADFEEQEQTPKESSPETTDLVASESLNSGEMEETPKVASESLEETPKVASESLNSGEVEETPKVASESLNSGEVEETPKVASESLNSEEVDETPKVASESLEETPKVASESLNSGKVDETPKDETPKVASESLEETPKVASESLNSGEMEETPKVESESLNEETPKVASESLNEETPKVASESLNSGEMEETPKVASEVEEGVRGNVVPSEVEEGVHDVCLLFLTYDNLSHADKLSELGYFNTNIFIHPKYANNVISEHKKYIIPTLIETAWGTESLVNASVLLLKHALSKAPNAKWFVLLSQDVYPMKSFAEFNTFLNSNPKSKFHFVRQVPGQISYNGYSTQTDLYKSSQWWVLNATDAKEIVKLHDTFKITGYSKAVGAIDELYFLSALMYAGKKKGWTYHQYFTVYDEWLKTATQKHPSLFNKLIQHDANIVKQTGAFLMRKTTPAFNNTIYTVKPLLYIAVIGTNTKQAELLKQIGDNDVFCVVLINMEQVLPEIINKSIKVYGCHWSDAEKAAREILQKYEYMIRGTKIQMIRENGTFMRGGADDSQEEEAGESEDVGDDTDDDDKYKQDPTGMPLKNPNPFLKRLKQRDPRLFLTRDQGKYRAYSTKCQPTERQPVILTDAEKEKIDRENPGSYKHAIKYGTDKDHQFWYICPRYWCFRTNTSITEEDVKAGKCGRVITDEDIKRGTVPKDAHVYEFKSAKTHLDAKGKYIPHYPGFATKDDMHPDGFCLPCCFKEWDSGRQGTKKQECMNPQAAAASRPAGAEIRQQLYIMDSYPLPNDRWGFLPNVARMFFGVDYKPVIDKHNASSIIPGQFVLLRYGVEQVHSQSFLGVFADMYAAQQKTPIPSVSEFRELLATAITLDVFINIHNASLPQIFKKAKKGKIQLEKYKNTDFYKRLSVAEDKDHRLFFEDAVVAYENFQEYLRDSNTEIDHTYLWDVFCAKMANIHPDGLNLVMLEIVDNDATEKIELVCPTNTHSSNSFDPKKQTVFVLKRDEFYEPIYLYKTDGKEIQAQKTFSTASLHPNIKQILNMVGKVTGKYCAPLTSLPKVYKFRTPVNATELLTMLGPATKFTAVVNYRNKVVGIHNGKVVIPCYPSSLHGLAANLPVKFMDEPELFADYETTRDELQRVYDASPKINCKPAFKIVDEGLIVGILTLTNQFVQISTPSENVMDDGIETMENPNWNDEDRSVVKGQDSERVKMSKWISLESQFYAVFQMLARELLQDPIQSHKRDKLIRISDSQTMDYATKIKECERILRELMSSSVEFAEMEDGFLLHLDNVSGCYSGDESPYCVMQDDGTQKTLFPSKHLLSGFDNDKVYYGRLADQLVRYSRVRTYVLFPDVSINTRTVDYDLDENELLLVHSDITPEYFRRIDSSSTNPYVANTAYDFAQPSITQYYSRDTVPFDEQYNLANVEQDQTLECVKPGLIPIVGNTRSMWVQSFPKTAREKVFLNTPECTFHLMVHILQDYFNKPINVAGVRKLLWVAYAPYMEHYAERIVSVLKAQGKHLLMESVEKRRVTLETLIFSNNYYLSDLDIWVMASRYNLPIIIFTSTFLKGFSTRISWLRAGMDKTGGLYYFVRSGVTTTPNNIGENHLVVPKMATTGLGEFSEQFKAAISGDEEHKVSVISFDAFMQSR